MSTTPRSLLASHRDDAATVVERADRFSLGTPVVGRVSAAPANRLAFYRALGRLAAANVIDWPVALAIGVGEAIVTCRVNRRRVAQAEVPSASEVASVGPDPTSHRPALNHPASQQQRQVRTFEDEPVTPPVRLR